VTAARSDLPPGIDQVIATAMAVSAADRYPSCGAFIGAAWALLGADHVGPSAAAAAPVEPAAAAEPAPTASGPEQPAAEHAGAPPGTLRLVAQSGFGRGRELVVADELMLGRLTLLDGALAPDHSISRRHARISRTPDGFAIQDVHSRNGTFVNGERIEEARLLQTGDQIQVGDTVFVAEVADAGAPVNGQPAPQAATVEASGAPKRVVLRLELDVDSAELTVSFENGPTARIVREDDGWRVETP
jgi:hypothetical protein